MNINITNLMKISLKFTKVLSETVPNFELRKAKECFSVLFRLNLMQNTVQGMPRNTS